METLHSLRRGERNRMRYTDKFGVRSEQFVPASKLPAPRWSWDYDLSASNADFAKQVVRQRDQELLASSSPLEGDEEWPTEPWTPGALRCGAVGVKIGCHPLWFRNGEYAVCTLVQLLDCHVVKHIPKEDYNNVTAAAIVGCKNASPFYRNEKYGKFCHEAGIPIKSKCFRFAISESAAIKPGTKLDVTHFRPGQYVDCMAKTVGYGMQGVMQRFKVGGGPSDKRGSHGWHRRIGSIGNRSGHVWKGTKMPGQLGGTYITTRGLQILRLNTRYNVLYIKGRMPGHVNTFVKINDSIMGKYRPQTEEQARKWIGPYPRYIAESNEKLADDIYHESVLPLDEPTISYS